MNLPSDKRSAWRREYLCAAVSLVLCFGGVQAVACGDDALLPSGVKAVWDLDQAFHETTPTRQRISINGLWRLQPAVEMGKTVPVDGWGYGKVPASWAASTQNRYPHPSLERQEREDARTSTSPGISGKS